MLKKSHLRWAGHAVRMPDERLPKHVLYGELQLRARSRGGQKKRFKDTLKLSQRLKHWPQLVRHLPKTGVEHWCGRLVWTLA